MTRNAFALRYLDDMARHGVGIEESLAAVHASTDLGPTTYAGRCLNRPGFLADHERVVLEQDLGQLHSVLTALPDRLFDGDPGAFARAVGATERQAAAVLRTRSQAPIRLARADLYHDGTAFRLMELNMGSNLGGLDNAVLNPAFLAQPAVAEFVAANRLTFVDTMAELAGMMSAEFAAEHGERPLFVAVDTPDSFAYFGPQLHASAKVLGTFGIDIVACHLGQLEITGDGIWLDGRRAQVIYRLFAIEDLLDEDNAALAEPVLRAVERGQASIFVPMDTELYGSKATLAMLSDEANRELFDAVELASLDRLLPWTRMVRPGPVTVDGERVDFLEYVTAQRAELVLKPTLLHGAQGVVLGWKATAEEWADSLKAAVDGPYVVQRRLRGVPEPFADTAGGRQDMLLKWGVFLVGNGYGGALVSGSTDLSGAALNSLSGTTLGCCFHEEPA